jgi:hypothetical protein
MKWYCLLGNIKCFIDPYHVIKKYKSCAFKKAKSKSKLYKLGVVWKYANDGTNLSSAHNCLIDVKAQTDIFLHCSFVPFLDRSLSIQPIDEIFSRRLQNEWKKDLEPICPDHAPWIKLTTITTSRGSPNGKIRMQVHKGYQKLDRHSSLSMSYTWPKACAIFSSQFFHWHSLN